MRLGYVIFLLVLSADSSVLTVPDAGTICASTAPFEIEAKTFAGDGQLRERLTESCRDDICRAERWTRQGNHGFSSTGFARCGDAALAYIPDKGVLVRLKSNDTWRIPQYATEVATLRTLRNSKSIPASGSCIEQRTRVAIAEVPTELWSPKSKPDGLEPRSAEEAALAAAGGVPITELPKAIFRVRRVCGIADSRFEISYRFELDGRSATVAQFLIALRAERIVIPKVPVLEADVADR
jgi:hypothetical protein